MSVVCAFPRARLHLHRLALRVVRVPRQVGLYWYNARSHSRIAPNRPRAAAARWMEKMCQGGACARTLNILHPLTDSSADTSFPNSRIAPYTARVTSSNAFTTSRMPARASRAVGSKCAPTRSSTFAPSDAESRHVSAGTCIARDTYRRGGELRGYVVRVEYCVVYEETYLEMRSPQ